MCIGSSLSEWISKTLAPHEIAEKFGFVEIVKRSLKSVEFLEINQNRKWNRNENVFKRKNNKNNNLKVFHKHP